MTGVLLAVARVIFEAVFVVDVALAVFTAAVVPPSHRTAVALVIMTVSAAASAIALAVLPNPRRRS